MILSKLQGGLGNQMFQYAAARVLAKANQYVHLDHSFLESNIADTEIFKARRYELGIFENLKAKKATGSQRKFFNERSAFYRLLFRLRKVNAVRQHDTTYVDLQSFRKFKYLYLSGYFQSEDYFKDRRTEILSDFGFPPLDSDNESLKEAISSSKNAVSVHIRRGDYITSKFVNDIHGVMPLSYYYDALTLLKERFGELTLFVFSDEMDWVKANLKIAGNITYIDHNKGTDSWKDMALMSHCAHHIIANSTFSWWGAWLGQHPDKMIIAPKNWFNDQKLNEHTASIIPRTWMQI